MSEHQKETAFLRRLISYTDHTEWRELDDRIKQLERDELCLRRAVWITTLCAALAVAGLCYSTVFLLDHRMNAMQFLTHTVIKGFSALALGSLVCAVIFRALGVFYRRDLDQHREQCRRLAMELIESRLGIEAAARNEVVMPSSVSQAPATIIATAG